VSAPQALDDQRRSEDHERDRSTDADHSLRQTRGAWLYARGLVVDRSTTGRYQTAPGAWLGRRRPRPGRAVLYAGAGEGPNGPVLAPTKTGRTYRVELDAVTNEVLASYRPRVDAEPAAFVFSHADGRPWLPSHVTRRFISARTKAGLDRLRLHDLRHFMATQMLAAGVPIVVVSQRLSHARASTTLNVYAHAVPGGDRAAAETIASMLGP
jgi:integrase